jgi:MOSC domain-containing protein YiiM
MTARVVAVNVGIVTFVDYTAAPSGTTGIDKRPATGPVVIRTDGVAGDHIGEPRLHGGVDQAVYAYAREDARWWERELDRVIPPGRFGENLSTEGLDVTGAVIGEEWVVGTTVLQVTRPRTPCRTFAAHWGVPDLVRRFTDRAAPGAYLRVLVEGEIAAGDEIEVRHRPTHGVTVGEAFRALLTEPALLPRLLTVPELSEELRARVRRRVGAEG